MLARKTAALVLAGLLAVAGLTLTAPRASAVAPPSFDDVPVSHPYYTHITWLASSGITYGVGDGSSFAPDASITRGQMAVFLYKLAGSPNYVQPEDSPFADVPESHTFYKHITWLAEIGITSGVGDGSNFAPNAPVSRGQMAVFLYKLAGSPSGEPQKDLPFSDVPTSHTFYKHIVWLSNTGITSGVGDGSNFAPSSPVTRGQMAVFLYKYFPQLDPWAHVEFNSACEVYVTFINEQDAWAGGQMLLAYINLGPGSAYFFPQTSELTGPWSEPAPPGVILTKVEIEVSEGGPSFEVPAMLGDNLECTLALPADVS